MPINISEIYIMHNLKNKNLDYYNIKPNFEYICEPNQNGDTFALLHVKDTIHYNALKTNNFKYYEEYIKLAKQHDHNLKTFLRLRDSFNLRKMRNIKVKYCKDLNKYILYGGTHRLSILTFNQYFYNNNIPLELVDDITNKKEEYWYLIIIIVIPIIFLWLSWFIWF
jgi:glutaredoxin-related protein